MSVSKIPLISPMRCVLLITDDSLHVYEMRSKTKLLESLPWDTRDFEARLSRLISHDAGGKRVVIINDMVEQHYRKERVPKISPLDRANVIRRRLNAAFPSFKTRAALPLKEKIGVKKGRDGKDELEGSLYLFAALPHTESFLKTIEGVRRSAAVLSGYTMLPVEGAGMSYALSQKLAKQRSNKKVPVWTVFIGQHRGGGLRQIVTKNGELALTRITPVIDSDNDPDVWAADVAQEFQSTVSYLSRFGYNPEDGLDVIVICKPACGEILENLIDVPCNFVPMTAFQAGDLLGISIAYKEEPRYADILHAAWIGGKARFTLPMQAGEIDAIAKPRQAALAVSWGLALVLLYLLYAGALAFHAWSGSREELTLAEDDKTSVDRVYDQEMARKESLGFDVKQTRAALKFTDQVRAQSLDPLPILEVMSKNLNALRIDSVTMEVVSESIPNPDPAIPDQVTITLPRATFLFSFPGDTEPMAGNKAMEELTTRLATALPDYTVELSKKLADLSFTGEMESEAGLMADKRKAEERYDAEITITKKKEALNNEGNTGS